MTPPPGCPGPGWVPKVWRRQVALDTDLIYQEPSAGAGPPPQNGAASAETAGVKNPSSSGGAGPALAAGEFPGRLTLELTNHCNYRCPMCPSRLDLKVPRGLMPAELFKRIVDEAVEHLPVGLVPFFRGESLMHPELAPLIAYAVSRGLGPVQLASNGSLLDRDLSARLLDSGLDFISFSVDTVDEAEYRRQRRGGELHKVRGNIEDFIAMRDRGGYRTEIQVSATRTERNEGSIRRFVDFWLDRADRVRIYVEHSKDGHLGSLDVPGLDVPGQRLACHKPFSDMVVYFDGKVGLCNHDWFRGDGLGDVSALEVAKVWHSPVYEELRAQHLSGRVEDATCAHCDHWKVSYLEDGLVGELHVSPRRRRNA